MRCLKHKVGEYRNFRELLCRDGYYLKAANSPEKQLEEGVIAGGYVWKIDIC